MAHTTKKVKIALGAADVANLASVGSGAIDTGTMRIALATDSPGVTTLGQVAKAASIPVTMATDQEASHDAVDSGTPTKIGFRAIASQHGLTLVAAADRTDAYAGLDGFQLTRPHTNLESIVSGNANNTDGTSTSW